MTYTEILECAQCGSQLGVHYPAYLLHHSDGSHSVVATNLENRS